MKTLVAMFCIALSLLYATASAASVLDQVQHQSQPAQHHQHGAFSDLSFDDHHQDGDSEASHDPDSGHHHHADGPQGIIGEDAGRSVGASSTERRAILSDQLIVSPGSPGPERPPKGLTFSV
ncbi:hypothetical protein JKL49_11470 [Phenylobacterium sp. 20VBR1]|uniref:Secreted protein n=2 Tax=Phenylobacterium glaciei TaxID=2803784 RepID=A0A941D146_9CAUL|nr:hypothetical protein [Phenylobacterium glaciei]MBR7620007.1 hypothetical protein [Phenylobacterium glaciei]